MKNKPILILLIILFVIPVYAQFTRVSYDEYRNGALTRQSAVMVQFAEGLMYLESSPDKVQNYLDFERREKVSLIESDGQYFKTLTSFDSLPVAEEMGDGDSILGYECKRARFSYFSNTIEVHYTEEALVSGSPWVNFVPSDRGLALKLVMNGNRSLIARAIEHSEEDTMADYPYEDAITVGEDRFEEMRILSRYFRLPVFKEARINFDPSLPVVKFTGEQDEQVFRLSRGSVVMKKIRLPEMLKKGAYTFLDLSCRSDGDAYDRTGSVFAILDTNKMSMLRALEDSIELVPSFADKAGKLYHGFVLQGEFEPPVELMRFFTSFGVGHFNDKRVIHNYPWFGSAYYKQDISALIPNDVDEIWIGVFIGNYDKGGHLVDLNLNFYPRFEEGEMLKKYIQPLFNTVNIMEMSGQNYSRFFKTDTLRLHFELPAGLDDDLSLLYTSTGHGGWGGGDEFNPRLNRIILDGKEIFNFVPWRTDCATYRLYNPASGNFFNGLSSSDLSRSNWCPGTCTPPEHIPLKDLGPGTHTLELIIEQGEDEGSSFNSWSVSGVLTASFLK